MTKRLRRILFWSVVAIFIIATPIFLAYSFGYFFDFQELKWVGTGSAYLSSNPEGAEVFINGEKNDKKTPGLIKLRPGQYLISVQKEGHHSWQKILNISSHQVTEARNIFLPLKNPLIEPVNISSSEIFEFFGPTQNQKDFAREYLSQQKEFTTQPVFNDSSFYFLKKPGLTLFKKNLFNDLPAQQVSFTNLDFCDCSIADPQIILGPNDQVSIITPEGDLFLLANQEFKKIHSNVSNAKFASDGTKLLILNSNEIWVYYLSTTNNQPFHYPDEKIFLARFAAPIISANWYFSNQHILFSTQNKIKMIELDDRDSRNIVDLIPAKNATVFIDFNKELIYFESQNQFFSLTIED